jgi:monofunctional biosynthetic peptidoglycan transglycosylase
MVSVAGCYRTRIRPDARSRARATLDSIVRGSPSRSPPHAARRDKKDNLSFPIHRRYSTFPRPEHQRFNPLSRVVKKFRRVLLYVVLACVAGSLLSVLTLRWINPPFTSFMLIRQIEAWRNGQDDFRIEYEWRYWNQISPELFLAVVAAEDQKYPAHFGFDTDSIQHALLTWQKTGRLRGASTITQQTAKNLYLWSGRSALRKALEAYFTMLLEIFLEKKRILEIYANIVEFGNGVYGAESASLRYFGKPARRLTEVQASQLAAVLPNPRKYHADQPSTYVAQRSRWIRRQMTQLGGILYLQNL